MTDHTLRDPFNARASLQTDEGRVTYYRLAALQEQGIGAVERLPFSIKVLLESALRSNNGFEVTDDDVARLARWSPAAQDAQEIPFKPVRVVLQDFTGVPSLVDLAALRSAMQRTLMARLGYLLARSAFDRLREKMDPRKVNGGVFLGLNGIVIKSHGGTDAEGFASAIGLAYDMVRNELLHKIAQDLIHYHRGRFAAPADQTEGES